jgi:catechol 2,3-dioxygenase-like lactoylglutathione lyase family enzyme
MPAPVPIRGVNHLGRVTKRLPESLAFYRDVLGFRPIERPNFNFAGAWLFNYGVQIHLIVNEAAGDPSGEIQTRADHLALFVEDIEACKSRLVEHGIPFRENHVPGRNVHQVFFRDPDGNHIELATYPPTPEFV